MEEVLANLRAASDALRPYKGVLLLTSLAFIVGLSAIAICVGLIEETVDRILAWRRRFGPTWYCSSWQQDDKGNWLHQPILSIDGAKYVFDTPQEYIAVFQEIGRRCGDPNGNVKRKIEALHYAARI